MFPSPRRLGPVPRARVGRRLRPSVVCQMGGRTLHLAGAPVFPGDVAFVQLELGDGVALGVTVVAGPTSRDGTQVFAAYTPDDRAMLRVATRLAQLLYGRTQFPVRSSRPRRVDPSSAILPFPRSEVPYVA